MAKQKPIIRMAKIGEEVRLVRANNVAQVRNHVAKNLIEVSTPTQDELMALAAKGIKVEELDADPEPQEPAAQ